MKLYYSRKSKYSFEDSIKRTEEKAKENDWQVIGQSATTNNFAVVFINKPKWSTLVAEEDSSLLGLWPFEIFILFKDSDIHIGAADPLLLHSFSPNIPIRKIAEEANMEIKNLIDTISGSEALKPKKVKLYSTLTCPYCKMEKVWLEKNKIQHEVVYVDVNQEAGQELVERTGQMSVPVTEILYEENEPDYIIGFDKNQLSGALNIPQ